MVIIEIIISLKKQKSTPLCDKLEVVSRFVLKVAALGGR